MKKWILKDKDGLDNDYENFENYSPYKMQSTIVSYAYTCHGHTVKDSWYFIAKKSYKWYL